jgi:hypothetical protein
MQDKASTLINILRDGLRQIEEDSKHCPNDPELQKLRSFFLQGIAALEPFRATHHHSQAA